MRKTVLITGAASGIGYELTKLFYKGRRDLILVDINESLLEKRKKELSKYGSGEVHLVVEDLISPDAASRLRTWVDDNELKVDILVNNAGIGVHGRFLDVSIEDQLKMMNLNMDTLVSLTYKFLPDMVKRNTGGVLNLGSIASFEPGPLMSTYFASKAFVLSFTVALATELSNTRLKISCLCPGPTDTNFAETAGATKSTAFSKVMKMNPEEVARAGYDGFKSGRKVIVPGMVNNLAALGSRFIPLEMSASISYLANYSIPKGFKPGLAGRRSKLIFACFIALSGQRISVLLCVQCFC